MIRKKQWLIILGLFFYTGPFWGYVAGVIGIGRALVFRLEDGSISPETLSEGIEGSFLMTEIGILIGMFGAVLIVFSLLRFKNEMRYFFWLVMAMSVLWCLLFFPMGVFIGGAVMLVFILERRRSISGNN